MGSILTKFQNHTSQSAMWKVGSIILGALLYWYCRLLLCSFLDSRICRRRNQDPPWTLDCIQWRIQKKISDRDNQKNILKKGFNNRFCFYLNPFIPLFESLYLMLLYAIIQLDVRLKFDSGDRVFIASL